MTRTEWLRRAVPSLRRMIRQHHPLTRRISVRAGLSGTGPDKTCTLGATECPNGHATIEIANKVRSARLALAVLLHELIHAAQDRWIKGDHNPEFRSIARKVGFRSPYRSIQLGPKLDAELRVIAQRLGPLPKGDNP